MPPGTPLVGARRALTRRARWRTIRRPRREKRHEDDDTRPPDLLIDSPEPSWMVDVASGQRPSAPMTTEHHITETDIDPFHPSR
ncbi:hypothetical protein GCM10009800_33720 [Nocardiopsis rhodophaea]